MVWPYRQTLDLAENPHQCQMLELICRLHQGRTKKIYNFNNGSCIALVQFKGRLTFVPVNLILGWLGERNMLAYNNSELIATVKSFIKQTMLSRLCHKTWKYSRVRFCRKRVVVQNKLNVLLKIIL